MRSLRLTFLALALVGCSGGSMTERLGKGTLGVAVNSEADLPGPQPIIPIVIDPPPDLPDGQWPSVKPGTRLRVVADSGNLRGESMRHIVVKIEDGDHTGKMGEIFRASFKPLE